MFVFVVGLFLLVFSVREEQAYDSPHSSFRCSDNLGDTDCTAMQQTQPQKPQPPQTPYQHSV